MIMGQTFVDVMFPPEHRPIHPYSGPAMAYHDMELNCVLVHVNHSSVQYEWHGKSYHDGDCRIVYQPPRKVPIGSQRNEG